MKKKYEENIEKIIKSYDSKKQTMNNLFNDKNIQNENKNNKSNINIINEQDYNYLNQTSSSLYKMKKSKYINKTNLKSARNNNKVKYIKNNTEFSNNNHFKNIQFNLSKNNSSIDKQQFKIYQKNLSNENKKINQKNSIKSFYSYFPIPEPAPKTINYNFSINNNLKIKNDISTTKKESTRNTNNKQEDNNILYLLTNLNLSNLYNTFISNYISFNDLFLLTKEDFIEMKIPIGPRNRIIHFLNEYKKYGKLFNFTELSTFLNYYKQYIDKPILNEIQFSNYNNYEEAHKVNTNIRKRNFYKKNYLLINDKVNLCEKKTLFNNNKNSNSKDKYSNACRLKKYNSMNFFGTKENLGSNKTMNNIKNIKYKDYKNNSNSSKKIIKNNNSFKDKAINNEISNKRNNYSILCQKYNNINKKVNDFQENYYKIQKYSKYIDEKLSEFLITQKKT